MITLIVGKKGSGKTKKLIQLVNDATKTSSGNVVCIEKGAKLTYDIDHKARLVDIEQYAVGGYDALFGFLSGICAGNYDVTDIYVDSTLKITGSDLTQLASFIQKLNVLSKFTETNIGLSVSADVQEIPAEINDIVQVI